MEEKEAHAVGGSAPDGTCSSEMEMEESERFMRRAMGKAKHLLPFNRLPKWLQDNDYLHKGHRPPMESFWQCFLSVFSLHSETLNIWTHGLGCLFFTGLACYVLTLAPYTFEASDKLVFGIFFAGAILCLAMSTSYHTLSCHSERVEKIFSKLDYVGIAFLVVGSFVPWLYYGFFCEDFPKVFYLSVVSSLFVLAVIVSLWDRFSKPRFRTIRAIVFAGFGLSGVIPSLHWFLSQKRFLQEDLRFSFIHLVVMGLLYLLGAFLYSCRIPERFFPGKCDYFFQSHQIFHILVLAAALVHYHGLSKMAIHKIMIGVYCNVTYTKNEPPGGAVITPNGTFHGTIHLTGLA